MPPSVSSREFTYYIYHRLNSTQSEIPKIVQKLLDFKLLAMLMDSTTTNQVLMTLQLAALKDSNFEAALKWIRTVIAQSTMSLSVSGQQLYTCLHSHLEKEVNVKETNKNLHDLEEMFYSQITSHPVACLFLHNSLSVSSGISVTQDSDVHSLTELYLATPDGHYVISLSQHAGEIKVWDTKRHFPVRTLHGIEKPRSLSFISQMQVLVLCNRELRLFDLDSCLQVCSVRGLLNLNMPLFCIRDCRTVIVLARNRMSVNVIDIFSGKIHATLKAGEDRFLNSLLVSADGSILVCGDDTQKPFPLLIWELYECKLLYDLRLPQHEFITSIADITSNGHYVATACQVLLFYLRYSTLQFEKKYLTSLH